MAKAQNAWVVAEKFEPEVAAAVEAALGGMQGKVKVSTVEAFVVAGDLRGLSDYLSATLGQAATPLVAALDKAVTAAGVLAAGDVNAALAASGKTLADQIPPLFSAPAQVVFQGVTPEFAYNPVNPATVQAVRSWQGALIQQIDDNMRKVVMDTIREGIVQGWNPRQTARTIRKVIPLTENQNRAVLSFSDDLNRIVEGGLRSAQTWGIYTPRQIAALKASNPARYRRLNFTADEIANGRRWAKISRAAGTLQFDPKTGIKASKPVGFVAPTSTQGGENAFRITPDGRPIDAMTEWRLRDKRFDPKIYDVVAAGEEVSDARAAMGAARTAAEKDAAAAAMEKALARQQAAQKALGAAQGEMVDAYRNRWLKNRSQVIARTESLRAANLGSYQSWRQAIEDSGLFDDEEVRRVWISARDDRVRLIHRPPTDGQKVGLREPFHIQGEAVMFPPHQPNCRCTVSYSIDLGAA